jgi:hypothetical protein
MLALLGNLVQIPDLVTYALIVWVGGADADLLRLQGAASSGPGAAPRLHAAAAAVPLLEADDLPAAVSSEIGVWFVRLMGIPVYLEGNVIDLGVYKLQVAEACSGCATCSRSCPSPTSSRSSTAGRSGTRRCCCWRRRR